MPVPIVIADDDPDFRWLIRYTLSAESGTLSIVGEAPDGETALTILRHERPDVLITDLMMPGLTGIELTAILREELPDTKVILISSYTEDAYRLMASDSGADAFVSKAVIAEPGLLVSAIRDVIARRLSGGSDLLPPSAGHHHRPTCP